jgi:hypothetical protein
MLAVLQTNGLRRASNKNVLGLSLLANTPLLYEEKPGGRIELLQLVWYQPTFTIHRGSTWLYQKARDISPCHPWQAWSGSGSEICSPTKPRYGLFISFLKGWPPYPKTSGGSQPRLYSAAPIAAAADEAGLAPSHWALRCPAIVFTTSVAVIVEKGGLAKELNLAIYCHYWKPRYRCDHQSAYCLHSAAPIAAATD